MIVMAQLRGRVPLVLNIALQPDPYKPGVADTPRTEFLRIASC